ncbi:MAG: hypothetical protein COB04_06140 [Gammaproteobacteria bacterium]|nr:MAG: hypothetical protein COB04_06140 [Gammaproteobacteria bacterium]
MLRVDLLCDKENRVLLQARNRLMAAFRNIDLPAHWHEWDIGDPNAPNYIRGRKQVTIFVNGSVVLEEDLPLQILFGFDRSVSRALPSEKRLTGVFLKRYFWPRFLVLIFPQLYLIAAVVPFLVLSALPSFDCPFCWPGFNSNSGWYYSNNIGWHYFSDYLFPLSLLALGGGLSAFYFRSYSLNDYLALFFASIAGVLVLCAKLGAMGAAGLWIGVSWWILAVIWSLHQKVFYKPVCRNCNLLSEQKRCA